MSTTRRAVTEEEKTAILRDLSEGNMTRKAVCEKYNRVESVVYKIMRARKVSGPKKSNSLALVNKALETSNSSALAVGVTHLIELLTKDSEQSAYVVKHVSIDVETRKVKACLQRDIEFTV
jgi:hypothetical protein